MVSSRLQWLLAVQVLIALSSLDLLVSSVEATPRHFFKGQKTQKTNGLYSSGPAGLASKIHEESTSKEVEFTAEQLSSSEDFRTYRPRLRSERERLLLASTRAKKARVKKRLPPKAAPPPPKNSRRIVAIPPPPPPPKNIGRGRCSPSPPPPLPTPMASYSLGKRNH